MDSSLHALCFCHSKWQSGNDIHDRTDCLTRPSQKIHSNVITVLFLVHEFLQTVA